MEVSCNHGNIVINMPSWWLMTSNGNLFETGPAWASQVLHLLQSSFLSLYSFPSLKQLAIRKGAHVCNSPSSIPSLLSFPSPPPQCLLILVYLNCWPVKSPNSPGWVNILAFLHHVLSSWHANFCLVEAVVTIETMPSESWAGLATIARQLRLRNIGALLLLGCTVLCRGKLISHEEPWKFQSRKTHFACISKFLQLITLTCVHSYNSFCSNFFATLRIDLGKKIGRCCRVPLKWTTSTLLIHWRQPNCNYSRK